MPWFFCYDTGLEVTSVSVYPQECRGFPGLTLDRSWVGPGDLAILDRALLTLSLGAQYRHWVVSLPPKPKGVRVRVSGLILSSLSSLLYPDEKRDVIVLGQLNSDGSISARPGDKGRMLQAYEQGYRYFCVAEDLVFSSELIPEAYCCRLHSVEQIKFDFQVVPQELSRVVQSVSLKNEVETDPLGQRGLLWCAVGELHTMFFAGSSSRALKYCQAAANLGTHDDNDTWLRYRTSLSDLSFAGTRLESSVVGDSCSPTRLLGYREPGEVSWADQSCLITPHIQSLSSDLLLQLAKVLEHRESVIQRGSVSWSWKARSQWLVASSFCPCEGALGGVRCSCSHARRYAFQRKLTPYLFDFFDLLIPIGHSDWYQDPIFSSWEEAKLMVSKARQRDVWKPKWMILAMKESRFHYKVGFLAEVIARLEGSQRVTQSHWMEAARVIRWHPWEFLGAA